MLQLTDLDLKAGRITINRVKGSLFVFQILEPVNPLAISLLLLAAGAIGAGIKELLDRFFF